MVNIFGKKQKGFTLIELVVVISILGIMVLLATPQFIGYTQEAKLSQIKNDVRAVEAVVDEYLIKHKALPDTLEEFDCSKQLEENKIYGKTGLITNLEGTYLDVTNMPEVKKINSKLKGNFIANNDGEAYYVSKDSIDVPSDKENGEVSKVPEEWLTKDYPKISVGGSSSFLLVNSNVYAFGSNSVGQLGLGDTANKLLPTTINDLKDKDIVKILGGVSHTYAISRNGDVYTFGANAYGQLGLGNATNQLNPVKNNTLSEFTSKNIKTVGRHSLLVENGKLYSWGYNGYGQLGLGDKINRNTPTEVKYFTNNNITIKNAYAGHYHSFATTTDNKLYVWGRNTSGQLGLGHNTDQLTPVELTFFGGIPIKDIKTYDSSTFVLTEGGKLYSFGYNYNGILGLGSYGSKNTPQRVNVDGKLIDKIFTGYETSIAIATDGSVYEWGRHLGKESRSIYDNLSVYDYERSPKRKYSIENLNKADTITDTAMGNNHVIIKTQSGGIYVLGYNASGQLGLGHTNSIFSRTKLDLSFIQ